MSPDCVGSCDDNDGLPGLLIICAHCASVWLKILRGGKRGSWHQSKHFSQSLWGALYRTLKTCKPDDDDDYDDDDDDDDDHNDNDDDDDDCGPLSI